MPSPALLLDIGNVIVHFDFTTAAERLAGSSNATTEDVLKRLTPFKDALESGQISDEDFVSQSIERIQFTGSREAFIAIWGDIFTANEPMMAFIRSVHGRVPLYLLSNTSGLHKDYLFANFDAFGLFEGGIYSHEAQCMKPHEPIFQSVIETFALDPAQTFYIDDLPDNIRAGERLGFVSHQYDAKQHSRFEREVQEWLEK